MPKLGRFALALALVPVLAAGVSGQSAQGSVTVASGFIWRGLTIVNRPVLQPEAWGSAGPVTLGVWANLEPATYEGDGVLSALGGRGAPGFTEFDPYVEVGRDVKGATLAAGVIAYAFTHAAGFETEPNTAEVYARVKLTGSLPLQLAGWYDVHAVRGAYLEAALEHGAPGLSALQLALRVGASLGEASGPESAYYDRNGITHIETAASYPVKVHRLEVSPSLALDLGVDPATRVTAPDRSHRAKLLAGLRVAFPAGED